jgi:hypothetical protein
MAKRFGVGLPFEFCSIYDFDLYDGLPFGKLPGDDEKIHPKG